jgi:stage V sporulation protein R
MTKKKKFNKFLKGQPILIGDNTVPGVHLYPELETLLPTIFREVRDFGCDFYPTVIQRLRHDEMSEIAAYGGFPVRYPHWKWGMEYEQLQRGYELGMHKIYEMVVNTNPCYIYLLERNTLVDDVLVVAHALGHCDFFKNNVFFEQTSQNMMNELANHGTRIRRYMRNHGKEKVSEFIDHVMRIQTLIDPAKAWERKSIKNPVIKDEKKYRHPTLLPVDDNHEYMDSYINPRDWRDKQNKKIARIEAAEDVGIFMEPTKDVMKFMRDSAPLHPWQSDILAMLYEESMYFAPQRQTKMLNEGWASRVDFEIMAKRGFSSLGQDDPSAGIIEYAAHKWGVLGGKYSMNPYKLGSCILQDIEERWDKGQFGYEWDNCTDMKERNDWDKELGLGQEKIFEVRKYYDDLTALLEFFTPEFCEKYEFFDWKKQPNGEYVVQDTGASGYKKIKKKLLGKYLNGGLPEIHLVDPNHRGKGYLFLQHKFDDKPLHTPWVPAVMESICYLWKNEVYLSTMDPKTDQEIVYCMREPNEASLEVMTREQYEKQ